MRTLAAAVVALTLLSGCSSSDVRRPSITPKPCIEDVVVAERGLAEAGIEVAKSYANIVGALAAMSFSPRGLSITMREALEPPYGDVPRALRGALAGVNQRLKETEAATERYVERARAAKISAFTCAELARGAQGTNDCIEPAAVELRNRVGGAGRTAKNAGRRLSAAVRSDRPLPQALAKVENALRFGGMRMNEVQGNVASAASRLRACVAG